MEDFKVSLDPKDNKTSIVSCYQKDLFISVKKKLPEAETDEIIFASKVANGEELYFTVLYPTLDPDFKKWSSDLFFEAIAFYFEEAIKEQPEYIRVITDLAFYPYQKGPDGLEDYSNVVLSDVEYQNFLNGQPFDYGS